MPTIEELEAAAEIKYGLPSGVLGSLRQQETGGQKDYIDDPSKPHYPTGYTKAGVKSSAFGPYGILESTAKQPGYGTDPLSDKSLSSQVNFAAQYLAGRSKAAGSLQAGLAGYGEGDKYAEQILGRLGRTIMDTATTTLTPEIQKAGTDALNRNDATASALENFQASMQGQYASLTSLLDSNAKNAGIVKTTEMMAVADAQAKSAEAAVALGTDSTSAGSLLSKIAADYNKHSERANMFADRVAYVQDPMNLFDNPIKYLGNALIYDFSEAGQKAAQSAADAAKNRFIGLNNMTQEVAQTQKAVAQSVTTETARLAGELASAEIQAKISQLNIEALKSGSDAVAKTAALRNDSLSIQLRMRDQLLQEQNIINVRKDAELKSESLRLSLEERSDRRELKKEELQTRENMLSTVNLGRQVNGNLAPFRSFQEMQTAANMNPEIKEMISRQFQAGLETQQTGVSALANSPYQAAKYMAATGAQLDPGRSKVIQLINRSKNQVLSDPKLQGTLKKESDIAKALDTTVLNTASAMASNITNGGADNLYSAPSVGVFTDDPTFKDTYIAKNILAPGKQTGDETLNFKSIVSMLVNDIRTGKIPMSQADSELGFLAEKIVGYNNGLYRYNATAGLPDMKSVNVALDDTSSFSSLVNATAGQMPTSPTAGLVRTLLGGQTEAIVDLRDPNKRAAYLNKRMAQTIPNVIKDQALVNNSTKLGGR